MDELGAILENLYTGALSSPRQLSDGARLYWSTKRRELLIARVNAYPRPDAMARYRERVSAAGYVIKGEREGEPINESLNTWLGFALALEPAKAPEPQAEQLTLGIE